MWRWIKRFMLGLVTLLIVLAGTVWFWGGLIASAKHTPLNRDFRVSEHPGDPEQGLRLARAYGCVGCHGGEGVPGEVLGETPFLDRLVAPNLTRVFAERSDAELEALIRQGLRPDGRSLFWMPSSMYDAMSDNDLAAIIGAVRALERQGTELPANRYGFLIRGMLVLGRLNSNLPVPSMEAELVDRAPMPNPPEDDPVTRGEYLAQVMCTECHMSDLGGFEGQTPSLAITQGYELDAFRRLMRDGVALGDRDVTLMSEVARARFTHLTDAEIAALYAYLRTCCRG